MVAIYFYLERISLNFFKLHMNNSTFNKCEIWLISLLQKGLHNTTYLFQAAEENTYCQM